MLHHIPLAFQCIYGCSKESGDGNEGREWTLPGLLYADDLVLCGELKVDLRVMVGQFVEMFRRRGMKLNTGKSKVRIEHFVEACQ